MPLIEEDTPIVPGAIWDRYDQHMMEVPGEWDTDARLCMVGQAPYPVTVNGVVISVTTNV
jgi:uracil-DNA glycosylase